MTWSADYGWLSRFWDEVLPDRADRILQLNTLFEGDLWLRDAFAWGVLCDHLHARGGRLECTYVRAWATEGEIPFRATAKRDLLFLGRTKAFESSRFAPYAHTLGSKMHARFIDAFDGRLGNSVAYGRRVFRRHDIEAPPDQFRRVDVDYAVIGFREADVGFESRRLVVISGLSTLGTLCATLLLADRDRRDDLVRQAREIAPWKPTHRPEESFELCIRFDIDSEERLANFLNEPRFHATLQFVALGGDEPRLRDDAVELILRPSNGEGRDMVGVRGVADVPITPSRFALLSRLVARNGEATVEQLCQDLELAKDDPGEETVNKRKRQLLAKMVHDLNLTLGRIPGFQRGRLIQMRGKQYVLTGVRGVVARR